MAGRKRSDQLPLSMAPEHGPDTPMEVSSSGTSDLNLLAMFVLDATKPFSSPAKFE